MKLVASLLVTLILFASCQSKNNPSTITQTKQIIVYGSDNCDHCVDFKAQLDSIGYKYDFRDVEFNEALNQELFYKVQKARITGRVSYPVIDIEGKILVAPALSEVMALM